MSRITDYILEKEHKGELIYNDSRGEYMSPSRSALADDIEYLEAHISGAKSLLKEKIREFNKEGMSSRKKPLAENKRLKDARK